MLGMRPDAFTGPLISDMAVWGGSGQVFGLALGYLYGEGYNYLRGPLEARDVLAVAGLASARLAVFAMVIVVMGHLEVAILD